MPDADHLREINHRRLIIFFPNHDVEFVEITVNETDVGHSDDEMHEFGVEDGGVVQDG
jgi:hypothetical protein